MKKHLLLIILVILSFHLRAADDKTYYLDSRSGEMVKFIEDQVILNLNVLSKHTNNYLYETKDKTDSTASYEISPSLKAQYHNDYQMLQLGLWVKSRKISNFSEDDTVDSSGLAKYHFKFKDNQSVVFSGAFFNNHFSRGTGLSQGQGDELKERDHRKSYFLNLAHKIGNEDSNANLTSMFGIRDTKYQNRPEATAGLNLSASFIFLDFQYSLSEKTYLTSKLSFEDVKHDIGEQQDRKISSALVGIKWHKTDFTHFDLSLGAFNVSFEDGALDSKQDFKWDAKFRWAPLEQLEFSALSLRVIDENRQIENSYLVKDKYGFTATYRYTDTIEFFSRNTYNLLEYYFEDGNESEESLISDLTIFYKFKHNMSLSFSYIYEDLKSVDGLDNYKRNSVTLGVSFVI